MRRKRNRRLRVESLEGRQMLATDLGQIVGTVALDLAGDGSVLGAPPVGLTVELWRDNGDGVFNAGTDTLESSTTTGAGGAYNFDNLTEASYFTRVNLGVSNPDNRLTRDTGATTNSVSSLITLDATEVMGSVTTVDDFTTAQTVSATAGSPDQSAADTANAGVGGVRDLRARYQAGTGSVTVTSDFSSAGFLNISSDSDVEGIFNVVWDGADGAGATIDDTGLSLDATGGGANSGFELLVTADNKPGSEVTIRVYSSGGRASEATLTIVDQDGSLDGDADESLTVDFSSFTQVGGSAGAADFAAVGAIELEIDFTDASLRGFDGRLNLAGIVGFTTETADLAVFPSLSLGNQVWIEQGTEDAMFMAGDLPLDGVALTLYEDTDADGDHTDEVAVATTTTAGGGLYQFNGLLPSDYIVQVDAANFTGVAPLAGRTTSTFNDTMGMAPDVDDAPFDDSKDRGTLAGDGSVVSQPVTLVGGDEPDVATDGDGTDANQLVDFAFLAPEVTVTKGVDLASATIGQTLEYTMVVTNTGLATATNVELTDTLPSGVTFVSGTTTVSGQTVNGSPSSQTVTSTIGTLAPGGMATVTIRATIDSTASGTLTNNVSITGTGDVNLTNNDASDQTVVAPTVDLTINKETVTAGPLEVGENVTFEITATNNGPSDATSVRVVDDLPTGLTYLDTLTGPAPTVTATAGGTQLVYNLGALGNGAQQTIRFRAQVATDTQPSFTNEARIELLSTTTETETNLDNNDSDAPISIQRQPISKRAFLSTSIA